MDQSIDRNRKGDLDYWEEPQTGGQGKMELKERLHLGEVASTTGESFWSMTLLGFTLAALGVAVYYVTRKRELPERITEYARTHWLH